MKTQKALQPKATTALVEVADTSSRREDSDGARVKRREFCSRLLLTSSALLVGDSILSAKPEEGGTSMGSISVACYKPRPGREAELLELVRNHLPPLRAERLVTDRAPIMMRTADGTIVEVFEWVSREAIEGAHKNPVVLNLWKKFESVCSYETPSNLKEFQNMFAHFEPI
jgi:hypothetical protein